MVKTLLFMSLALTYSCPRSTNGLLNYASDIDDCIWYCPKTKEYNPVCGSDGVTYWNRGHLRCAQYCGVDVYPRHQPPCSPDKVSSTTTESNNVVDVEQCIQECPKTPEYNPMCGSNGLQYNNMGYLTCAQWCGVDVKATHPAPCQPKI